MRSGATKPIPAAARPGHNRYDKRAVLTERGPAHELVVVNLDRPNHAGGPGAPHRRRDEAADSCRIVACSCGRRVTPYVACLGSADCSQGAMPRRLVHPGELQEHGVTHLS